MYVHPTDNENSTVSKIRIYGLGLRSGIEIVRDLKCRLSIQISKTYLTISAVQLSPPTSNVVLTPIAHPHIQDDQK